MEEKRVEPWKWTFRHLQEEQRPWVEKNFGDRPSWMPLLGIVEEILDEYEGAIGISDREVMDALADATIFLSDYCNAMGFDMEKLFLASSVLVVGPTMLRRAIGKIAHHHLKMEQGIRGTRKSHEASIEALIVDLLAGLRRCAADNGIDLVVATHETWQSVRERDWTKKRKEAAK